MKTKAIFPCLCLLLVGSTCFAATTESVSVDFSRSINLQTIVTQATQLSPYFAKECAVIWNGTGGATALPGNYAPGDGKGNVLVSLTPPPLAATSGVINVPVEKMVLKMDIYGFGVAGIQQQHLGVWVPINTINRSIVLNGSAGWLPLKSFSRIAKACIDTQITLAKSVVKSNLSSVVSLESLINNLAENVDEMLKEKIEIPGAVEVFFHGKGTISYRYADGSVLTAKEPPSMSVSLQHNGVTVYDEKSIDGQSYTVGFKKSGGAVVVK